MIDNTNLKKQDRNGAGDMMGLTSTADESFLMSQSQEEGALDGEIEDSGGFNIDNSYSNSLAVSS